MAVREIRRGRFSVEPEFMVKRDGLETRVYRIQGLDLTLEQRKPDGEKAFLSHYSDPGTSTFTVFMKFLYVSNVPVPLVRQPADQEHDMFDDGAHFTGSWNATRRFPITYGVQLPDSRPAVARINYQTGGDPHLEIDSYTGSTLTFSLKAAAEMMDAIQRLYPTLSCFRVAYDAFLEEAPNHQEQIMDVSALRRQRGRQLQFDFAKELRKPGRAGQS